MCSRGMNNIMCECVSSLQAILKCFPGTKHGFHLPVGFKSNELKLAIQKTTETWNVTSHFPPVVSKEMK